MNGFGDELLMHLTGILLGVAIVYLIQLSWEVISLKLRDTVILAAITLAFSALATICAAYRNERARPAPKCRCAEIFLAGVHDGAGVVFEAFTNTLHEAGIIMVPTGGRDE